MRKISSTLFLLTLPALLAACAGDDYLVKQAVMEQGLEIRGAGLDPLDPAPLDPPMAWADARDADSVVVWYAFPVDGGELPAFSSARLELASTPDPSGFSRWEVNLPARSENEALEYWFEAHSGNVVASWPDAGQAEPLRVEASPLVIDFPWPDWPVPEWEIPCRADPERILDGAEDQATLVAAFPFEVIRNPIWTPWRKATVTANIAGVRRGIGIESGGKAWFLPFAVMLWNEVANHELNGRRTAASYCPLTDTILHFDTGFDPAALPKLHNYAPAGLFNSNLSVGIEGKKSGESSPYNQMLGLAFNGPDKGECLKPLPAVIADANLWIALHPNTLVLEGDPETVDEFDYVSRANPYDEYWRTDEIRFPVARQDDRLRPKHLVFGLLFPDDPVVVPLGTSDFVYHTRAHNLDIVILYTGRMAIALEARHPVTGEPLRLHRARTQWRGTPLFEDESDDPGLWTSEGVALTGPAKGQRLAWIPSMSAFWFAWYAMYPEARFELPD